MPKLHRKVIANVDLDLEVPDGVSVDDLQDITFSIPIEKIVVYDINGPIKGAKVIGYTTQTVDEV